MPTNPNPQPQPTEFKVPDKLLKPKEYLATLQHGEEFHTVHGMGLACGLGGRELFFVLRKLQFANLVRYTRPLHYKKV